MQIYKLKTKQNTKKSKQNIEAKQNKKKDKKQNKTKKKKNKNPTPPPPKKKKKKRSGHTLMKNVLHLGTSKYLVKCNMGTSCNSSYN